MCWFTVTMLGMAHYCFRKGRSMQISLNTAPGNGESIAGEPDISKSDIGTSENEASKTAVKQDSGGRVEEPVLHAVPDPSPLPEEALSLDSLTDPWERHLLFTRLIETAYRNRRTSEDDLNTAMTLSNEYVAEFDSLKQVVFDNLKEDDRIVPVFRMLAIMLEQAQAYELAVNLCRLALDHGINDGTKTGFEGRIERLLKKQEPSVD